MSTLLKSSTAGVFVAASLGVAALTSPAAAFTPSPEPALFSGANSNPVIEQVAVRHGGGGGGHFGGGHFGGFHGGFGGHRGFAGGYRHGWGHRGYGYGGYGGWGGYGNYGYGWGGPYYGGYYYCNPLFPIFNPLFCL